ncbi:MAG TPA: hypothetical protein VIL37_05315 [Natronosporangium sp.]
MAGRHRNPTTVRIGRFLIALLTAVVVVAVGGAVSSTELRPEEKFRPFIITGELGEWFASRTFDLRVVGVRVAATIQPELEPELDTAGAWVVVRVQLMAQREAVFLDYARVWDSLGRSWEATERTDQPLIDGSQRLDPRIPVEGEIAFEVPRDAVTDLRLRLGSQTGGLYGLQMATLAEVPLAIDEAAVASGLAATEPVVIAPPEIVIAETQILNGVER